jgi:sterol desaturase/sphingolipid hydroxylase (fatty acid hydroxylase superfamily)
MLVAFSIIAVLAFVAERLWPARPQGLLRPGLVTDGIYLAINIVLRIAFTNTLAVAVSRVGQQLLPRYTVSVLSDAPFWVQTVAVIVAIDFCFYWMHRAKHRWAWWWRLHETHHSSRGLDWFSSVRFHPLEKIIDRLLYLLPLLFLGVSDGALLVPREEPVEFGLDDEAYPEGNIARQFTYAFRPMESLTAAPRAPLAKEA